MRNRSTHPEPPSTPETQEQLGRQCLQWLEDQVYSIREAATQNLQQLAQEFGSDWAKEHLVPQVRRPPASVCILQWAIPWMLRWHTCLKTD